MLNKQQLRKLNFKGDIDKNRFDICINTDNELELTYMLNNNSIHLFNNITGDFITIGETDDIDVLKSIINMLKYINK